MKQVFLNLGVNALAHMPDGGVLRVVAGVEKAPPSIDGARMVVVRFIDEGEGIDETVMDEIFQPFVTTKAAGSGMGLTIVETIMHTHSGAVTAENNPDGGATFSVWLPLADPDAGLPPVA
jgi:signal transduction histidine kinase